MKNNYLKWVVGILIASLFAVLFVIIKQLSKGRTESIVTEPVVPQVEVTGRSAAIANYKKSTDVYVKMMQEAMTELARLSRNRPAKEGEKAWKAQATLCISKLTTGGRGLTSIKNMPMECRQPHWLISRAARRAIQFCHSNLPDVDEISSDQNVLYIAQETKLLADQIAQFNQLISEIR